MYLFSTLALQKVIFFYFTYQLYKTPLISLFVLHYIILNIINYPFFLFSFFFFFLTLPIFPNGQHQQISPIFPNVHQQIHSPNFTNTSWWPTPAIIAKPPFSSSSSSFLQPLKWSNPTKTLIPSLNNKNKNNPTFILSKNKTPWK